MNFVDPPLDELVEKLEKSKNYLSKRSKSGIDYSELIEQINSKIDFINQNSKLVIKIVSTSKDLALKLQAKSEANYSLRSLYNFETIFPFKNLPKIVSNCDAIVFVLRSDGVINNHQYRLINLAIKKKVHLIVLLQQGENSLSITSNNYLKSQNYADIEKYLLLKDTFFDLNNTLHLQFYRDFLIDLTTRLKNRFVRHNFQETIDLVNLFFNNKRSKNWQKIKQIKTTHLEQREAENYRQQILAKTFKQIEKQQQQKVLSIKQALNQSRSCYTNPFMPDSWMFELQEIIERSQVKLVKEKTETYLYLVIENGKSTEYLHSYILNFFQEKATEVLKSQWSKINYIYAEGGLESFVIEANQKIALISLLNDSDTEKNKIVFDFEPFPRLDINNIVDLQCFKIHSRTIFDYSYTQSSWFKLLIFSSIGLAIYLITKIYFGTGRYIGFFILIFQIINIFTGHSIKELKLKSHKKELQRSINNKYQILIRLIVEQIIQASIANLEKKNDLYQTQINAILNLAHQKLDLIKQDVNQYQSIENKLDRDMSKIMSFLN